MVSGDKEKIKKITALLEDLNRECEERNRGWIKVND